MVADDRNPELMKTINVPKKLHMLANTLPAANYDPLETKTIEKQAFLQTLAGYKSKAKSGTPDSEKTKVSQSIDLEEQWRLKKKKERQAAMEK